MNSKPPDPERTPITLKQFIDDNQRLLSVVGIFAALLLLSNQVAKTRFSGLITFGLFNCLTLLWLELFAQFPDKANSSRATWRLDWFNWGVRVTLLFLLGYWLLLFEESFGPSIIIWPCAFGLVFLTHVILEKTGLSARFLRRSRFLSFLVALVVLVLGSWFGVWLSGRVHGPIHLVMDDLRQGIRQGLMDSTAVKPPK